MEEVDRISSLPESLIHHILSFLDMKYVVQTCILSTRWRYIWTSVATLVFRSSVFDDSGENKVHFFMRFVKRVLMLRGGSDIKKFDINLDFHFEKLAKHLDLWILAASRRNVEELNIIHWYGIDVRLPRCLVNSELLTGLVLNFLGYLVLPDTMGLPRLKSLVLVSIEVEDLEFINKLLSSCLVLETLRIQQIRAKAGDELCVSNSGLKHLEINHYYYGEGEPRIIRLCTPSLTSFICEDFMIRDYRLENLSSLVTANIKMTQVEDEDIGKAEPFPKGILVFLRAFHNVRKLTLSLDFLQFLSGASNLIECQLPQFRNLRCLKLEMCFNRCHLRALSYLLRISPCIETLFITSKELDSEDDGEVVLSESCVLSQLKFIEIREVKGCYSELIFLEFVLKNAIVLEEMVLYFCNAGSSPSPNSTGVPDKLNVMKKFSEKIKALPRVSSSLIMLFC